MRLMAEPTADSPREANHGWVLGQIEDALRSLRFGCVTLVVQDGIVVQIDRTDRRRYQPRKGDRPSQ